MSADWRGAGGGPGRGGDLLRYHCTSEYASTSNAYHGMSNVFLLLGVGDTASHPLRHTAMVLIDRVAQIQEGTSEHDTEGELQP